ncbi:AMP-binding protein, partial [Burkholderia pseudomallei]
YFDECTTRYAQRVAFFSAGARMTYAALARKAAAFASDLQSLGVKPGDRVAIMLPNTFPYPVTLFGTLKAGAIVVNVN